MDYSREFEIAGQIMGVEPENLPERTKMFLSQTMELLHRVRGQRNLSSDFVAVIVANSLLTQPGGAVVDQSKSIDEKIAKIYKDFEGVLLKFNDNLVDLQRQVGSDEEEQTPGLIPEDNSSVGGKHAAPSELHSEKPQPTSSRSG